MFEDLFKWNPSKLTSRLRKLLEKDIEFNVNQRHNELSNEIENVILPVFKILLFRVILLNLFVQQCYCKAHNPLFMSFECTTILYPERTYVGISYYL